RCLARGDLLASGADHDVVAAGVVSDVLRVQIERFSLQQPKRGAVKNLPGAVAAAGDEEAIYIGIKIRALRFVQIRNGVNLPARRQVNHFERVIVKRSCKETLALY